MHRGWSRANCPPRKGREPLRHGISRWSLIEPNTAGFRVTCDRAFAPPQLPAHVIRELELARLAESADTALAASDLEQARDGYCRFSSARHVTPRLRDAWPIWIERWVGRAEAALSTLLEAMPLAEAGFSGGELLGGAGHREGSILALRQAAERELYGPLAALALLSAADQTKSIREKLALLD